MPDLLDQMWDGAAGEASTVAPPMPAPVDESAFQKWYAPRAEKLGLNPNPDAPEHFYDYRAAYKSGAEPDATGHWPSEFKLPGHPREFLDINGQRTNTRTGELAPLPAPKGDLLDQMWDGAPAAPTAPTGPRQRVSGLTSADNMGLGPKPTPEQVYKSPYSTTNQDAAAQVMEKYARSALFHGGQVDPEAIRRDIGDAAWQANGPAMLGQVDSAVRAKYGQTPANGITYPSIYEAAGQFARGDLPQDSAATFYRQLDPEQQQLFGQWAVERAPEREKGVTLANTAEQLRRAREATINAFQTLLASDSHGKVSGEEVQQQLDASRQRKLAVARFWDRERKLHPEMSDQELAAAVAERPLPPNVESTYAKPFSSLSNAEKDAQAQRAVSGVRDMADPVQGTGVLSQAALDTIKMAPELIPGLGLAAGSPAAAAAYFGSLGAGSFSGEMIDRGVDPGRAYTLGAVYGGIQALIMSGKAGVLFPKNLAGKVLAEKVASLATGFMPYTKQFAKKLGIDLAVSGVEMTGLNVASEYSRLMSTYLADPEHFDGEKEVARSVEAVKAGILPGLALPAVMRLGAIPQGVRVVRADAIVRRARLIAETRPADAAMFAESAQSQRPISETAFENMGFEKGSTVEERYWAPRIVAAILKEKAGAAGREIVPQSAPTPQVAPQVPQAAPVTPAAAQAPSVAAVTPPVAAQAPVPPVGREVPAPAPTPAVPVAAPAGGYDFQTTFPQPTASGVTDAAGISNADAHTAWQAEFESLNAQDQKAQQDRAATLNPKKQAKLDEKIKTIREEYAGNMDAYAQRFGPEAAKAFADHLATTITQKTAEKPSAAEKGPMAGQQPVKTGEQTLATPAPVRGGEVAPTSTETALAGKVEKPPEGRKLKNAPPLPSSQSPVSSIQYPVSSDSLRQSTDTPRAEIAGQPVILPPQSRKLVKTRDTTIAQGAEAKPLSAGAGARDPLTGALGPGEARKSIVDAHQDPTKAVIMVDIDHFKAINDDPSIGHGGGDKILQQVAAKIQEAVGDQGHVARFGGEEFSVVVPAGEERLAGEIVKRVRESVRTPDGSPVTVSAGFGVGQVKNEKGETRDLADVALFRAKESGRNRAITLDNQGKERQSVVGGDTGERSYVTSQAVRNLENSARLLAESPSQPPGVRDAARRTLQGLEEARASRPAEVTAPPAETAKPPIRQVLHDQLVSTGLSKGDAGLVTAVFEANAERHGETLDQYVTRLGLVVEPGSEAVAGQRLKIGKTRFGETDATTPGRMVIRAFKTGHVGATSKSADFPEMVAEARRWSGAAFKADEMLGADTPARLSHSKMTTKGDMDAYLIRKFGVDATTARDVSNELTRLNLKPDKTANVEDFKGEPWADAALTAKPLTSAPEGGKIEMEETRGAAKPTAVVPEAPATPAGPEEVEGGPAGYRQEGVGAEGKDAIVHFSGLPDLKVRYAVVEAGQLIPSHTPGIGPFKERADYPISNPRDYAEPNLAAKVHQHAAAKQADWFLAESPDSTNGAPIVTASGVVVSGNGRTMTLQLAAKRQDYSWYKSELVKRVAALGMDPATIEGMNRPVLVRMVTEPLSEGEMEKYASSGNVTATYEMSGVRENAQLGDLIDNSLLDVIRLSSEKSNGQTVAQIVSGPDGATFRTSLRRRLQKEFPQKLARFFEGDGDTLSDAGKVQVRDLLFTKVFPVETIERMSPAWKDKLEAAIPQMLKFRREFPEIDPVHQIAEAVDFYHGWKQSGMKIQDYLDQTTMFGEPAPTVNAGARMMLDFLDEGGVKTVRTKLTNFLRELSGGVGLFAADETRTPAQIAAEALDVQERKGAEFGPRGGQPLALESDQTETPGEKQPWEMTKTEFATMLPAPVRFEEDNWRVDFGGVSRSYKSEAEARKKAPAAFHREEVRNAADEKKFGAGLADYPDLVEEYGNPSPSNPSILALEGEAEKGSAGVRKLIDTVSPQAAHIFERVARDPEVKPLDRNAAWAKAMLKDVGPGIHPYLKDVWAATKDQRKAVIAAVKAGETAGVEPPVAAEKVTAQEPPPPTAQAGPPESAPIPVSKGTEKATGEPIGQANIIRYMEKAFGVPIRVGHLPGKPLGIYKVVSENVRLKPQAAADLGVAAHEVAHHLDNKTDVLAKLPFDMTTELRKLDYDQKQKRVAEGFAEFVKVSLIDPATARKAAPRFAAHFDEWRAASPEYDAKLTQTEAFINQFKAQTPVERAIANISQTGEAARPAGETLVERGKEGISKKAHDLYRETVDSAESARQFDVAYEAATGKKLAPGDPLHSMVMAFARSGPHMAAHAMEHGITSVSDAHYFQKIGPGLMDVRAAWGDNMPKGKQRYREWAAYVWARQAKEQYQKGQTSALLESDADDIIAQFKNEPGWTEAAKKLTEVNNAALDMLASAGKNGVITKADAEFLKKQWENYFPLSAVKESTSVILGAGKRNAILNVRNPVKTRKGGQYQILDPIQATMQRVGQFYDVAYKQMAAEKTVDMAESVGGLGGLVEHLPPSQRATSFSPAVLRDALKSAGVDPSVLGEISPETLITVFKPDYYYKGKEPIATVLRPDAEGNLKPEMYQFDPDFFKTFTGMDQVRMHPALRVLASIARVSKLGMTGISTGFGARNIFRDYGTYLAQARESRGPLQFVAPAQMDVLLVLDAVRRMLGKPGSPLIDAFYASGIKMSNPLGFQQKDLARVRERMMQGGLISRAFGHLKHPIETAEKVIGFTDYGPRLAEFAAALKAEGISDSTIRELLAGKPVESSARSWIRATEGGRDVTTNFNRSGASIGQLNQLWVYLNANIQGADKYARTWKNNPKRALIYAASLAAAALAYWLWNRDKDWYKEQPSWFRNGFYGIDNGKGQLEYRLPMPREWGTSFTATLALLDSMREKDPAKTEEWVGSLPSTFLPSPTTFVGVPELEWLTNHDFFRDSDIVPQSKENLLPADQYNQNTTETMKWLGRKTGLSPMATEHLVEGQTGGLYGNVERTIEGVAGLGKKKPGFSEIPGVGAFGMRTEYNRSTDEFYNASKLALQTYNSARAEATREYMKSHPGVDRTTASEASRSPLDVEAKHAVLSDFGSVISKLNAVTREAATRNKAFETEKYQIGLARAALGKEELARYPNPFTTTALLPAGVLAIRDKALISPAETLAGTMPSTDLHGVSVEDRIARWERKTEMAYRFLKASGADPELALTLYLDWREAEMGADRASRRQTEKRFRARFDALDAAAPGSKP